MLTRAALSTGWLLALTRPDAAAPAHLTDCSFETCVPSDALSQLVARGLVPDPRLGANEDAVAWVGRSDWSYRRPVTLGPDTVGRQVDLVFGGIDTVAEVLVDGRPALSSANMHRRYRVGLGRADAERTVEVEVRLFDAFAHAAALAERLGPRPNVYDSPANFLRKAAYNFGWDWGPRVVTAGLWRDVTVEVWSKARLDAVRPVADFDGRRGRLALSASVVRDAAASGPLTVVVEVAGRTASALLADDDETVTLELPDLDVRPWQPVGHGTPARYPAVVRLLAGAEVLDEWTAPLGFRRAEMRHDTGAGGEGFEIVVNGEVVAVRGVNWIPDDCFPATMTRDRYAAALTDALDAGCNLVRVWGGGLYESDDFYDVCDELGLLVWQDFLFACAAYPEEEPFASEVAAEASDNAERLMRHPSLVLWNGNNEVIEGFQSWGWQEPLAGRTWGWGFFTGVLPQALAAVDPSRPYWPGSPYAGSFERPVNDPDRGTNHMWDVWNREEYEVYRRHRPRFAAEFGFQGPANLATLRDAVGAAHLDVGSPVFQAHQKAIDGQLKLDRSLAAHFGVPDDFDDWHHLAQVNQARAVTVGIDHLRSLTPWCSGVVWWQLNDCWPALSWAVVDSAGRRKPAWYALRRSYAARLLTVQPSADGLAVCVVNDTADELDAGVALALVDVEHGPWSTVSLPVRVSARSAATVPVPPGFRAADDPGRTFLTASLPGIGDVERALWFWSVDADLRLDADALDVSSRVVPGGVELTLAARGLVRDAWVRLDGVDADARVRGDRLVTLLPGEVHVVTIETTRPHDPRWSSPDVVTSVNTCLARASAPQSSSSPTEPSPKR